MIRINADDLIYIKAKTVQMWEGEKTTLVLYGEDPDTPMGKFNADKLLGWHWEDGE